MSPPAIGRPNGIHANGLVVTTDLPSRAISAYQAGTSEAVAAWRWVLGVVLR